MMQQPMDEEAQRAIREALASGDMPVDGAPVPPPSFDDSGSYLTPMENDIEQTISDVQRPIEPGAINTEMPAPQMGGQSQVTLAQREEAQRPSSGFDWGRALWAAGGGDISSFDAQRNREQDRQDKQVAAFDQKQLVRQGMDPQSEISRQRQGEYAQQMQSRAQIAAQSGMGELARTFAEEAKRASTMSATQIDRASQTFGGVLKESMGAAEMAAKQQLAQQGQDYKQDMLKATIGKQDHESQLDWANYKLKQEENQLRHAERSDSLHAKQEAAEERRGDKIPGDSGKEKYEERKVAERLVDEALTLLPKARYTGKGAASANALLSSLPESADIRTKEERELAGIISELHSKARKELFGAAISKTDIKDAASFMASLGGNKETIATNLKRLKQSLREQNQSDETLYPGLRKISGITKTAPTGSSMPVGKRAVNPSTGEVIEWDGNKWQPVTQ